MTSVVQRGNEHEVDLRVVARRDIADGVVLLELAEASGHVLPAWEPGAHVDLVLAPGMVRQYSLCGDPAYDRLWSVAVLREDGGRGGSVLLHDTVAEGALLRARGPRNHFPLEQADSYLFVGGGIGITPLLPMIAAADASGRPWKLLYGGRTRSSMAFLDDLARHGNNVVVQPQDEHGLLDLDSYLGTPVGGGAIYCCGPEPLLDAVQHRVGAWPAGSLHVERFTPKSVVPSGPDTAFDVVCEASGLSLHVPADRSILDVVAEAGIDVLTSCEEGTCGSCETRVLTGTPDQRDSVLSDEDREAGQFMMICVSRSLTPQLVLDL
jgi:ferredoxin-NADP reductase